MRDETGKQLFFKGAPFFSCLYVGGEQKKIWLATDKSIEILDSETHELVGTTNVGCELVFSMLWIDSREEVWAGGLDNSICVYDSSTAQLLHTIPQAHKKRVNRMCVSEDQSSLYSACEDGNISVWNVAERQALKTVRAHDSRCNYVSWIDGRVWSCAWDTTVHVYDPEMNLVTILSGYNDDAVFSLTNIGNFVWTTSGDKGLTVWHLLK